MPSLPATWPPWFVVACAVAAAGVLIWILAKAMKWFMWLLLIAILAACAIAAAHLLYK
jgi:hypothetical protein